MAGTNYPGSISFNTCPSMPTATCSCYFLSVHFRHDKVHEDDIWIEALRRFQIFFHFPLRLRPRNLIPDEGPSPPFADHRVVVYDEDADGVSGMVVMYADQAANYDMRARLRQLKKPANFQSGNMSFVTLPILPIKVIRSMILPATTT